MILIIKNKNSQKIFFQKVLLKDKNKQNQKNKRKVNNYKIKIVEQILKKIIHTIN